MMSASRQQPCLQCVNGIKTVVKFAQMVGVNDM